MNYQPQKLKPLSCHASQNAWPSLFSLTRLWGFGVCPQESDPQENVGGWGYGGYFEGHIKYFGREREGEDWREGGPGREREGGREGAALTQPSPDPRDDGLTRSRKLLSYRIRALPSYFQREHLCAQSTPLLVDGPRPPGRRGLVFRARRRHGGSGACRRVDAGWRGGPRGRPEPSTAY